MYKYRRQIVKIFRMNWKRTYESKMSTPRQLRLDCMFTSSNELVASINMQSANSLLELTSCMWQSTDVSVSFVFDLKQQSYAKCKHALIEWIDKLRCQNAIRADEVVLQFNNTSQDELPAIQKIVTKPFPSHISPYWIASKQQQNHTGDSKTRPLLK